MYIVIIFIELAKKNMFRAVRLTSRGYSLSNPWLINNNIKLKRVEQKTTWPHSDSDNWRFHSVVPLQQGNSLKKVG
jgi:hypothetical protein